MFLDAPSLSLGSLKTEPKKGAEAKQSGVSAPARISVRLTAPFLSNSSVSIYYAGLLCGSVANQLSSQLCNSARNLHEISRTACCTVKALNE